jgi:hypothetical protein
MMLLLCGYVVFFGRIFHCWLLPGFFFFFLKRKKEKKKEREIPICLNISVSNSIMKIHPGMCTFDLGCCMCTFDFGHLKDFGKKRATLKKKRAIRVKIEIEWKMSIGCGDDNCRGNCLI